MRFSFRVPSTTIVESASAHARFAAARTASKSHPGASARRFFSAPSIPTDEIATFTSIVPPGGGAKSKYAFSFRPPTSG